MFMQSNGGLTDARRLPGQGRILSGPAGGIVGAARDRARGRLRADHRLRHGRHLDRRLALRRRVRARLRDPGRRRAHARADDADPHRRGRRRLDPASSTASRFRVGPDSRRRRSRPGLLPPRRPAHRHRLQRDARPASSPSFFPPVFGPNGDQPLDARRRRAEIRRARRRDPRPTGERTHARSRSPRASCAIAVENMANAIKQISIQRGYDVTRLRAALLRRRRRPARLPRRRRARHDARSSCHPLRRRALGLWHGPRRRPRAARAGRRGAARRPPLMPRLAAPSSTRLEAGRRGRDCAAQGIADDRNHRAAPRRICATTAPTRR